MHLWGAYAVSGLVLGSIYALAGLSIAFTYKTTGIFNFALGGMAFFVARFFYQLTQIWHWNRALAGLFCVLVLGPAIGLFLWAVLFRQLAHSSMMVRMVATIGLLVALPPLAQVIFGLAPTLNVVGLGSPKVAFHLGTIAINWNQTVVVILTAALGLGLTAIMRLTRAGLVLRAAVDSPEMGVIYGVNPNLISASAWAVGSSLAGLVGILIAPSVGLDTDSFNSLVLAALATVAVAKLNRLAMTFVAGIAIGLIQQVVTKYAPPSNLAWAGLVPSVPFFILIIVTVWLSIRTRSSRSQTAGSGAELLPRRRPRPPSAWIPRIALIVIGLLWLFLLPSQIGGFWLNTLALGLAYAAIMASFVVTTGELGVVSLCQPAFVGLSAIALSQTVTVYGGNFVVGLIIGCLIAAVAAALLAACTVRLGPIYVALLTLGFGYVVENMVYPQERFDNFQQGVVLPSPQLFGQHLAVGKPYFYFATIVFVIIAFAIRSIQRATLGLEFSAVRGSRVRSSTLGIRNTRMVMLGLILGAVLAAVGGALLAISEGTVRPSDYPTATGIVWFAVAVTLGVRSVTGAALAGLSFSVAPALVGIYLPHSWAPLPTILFGLGAIGLAREPLGAVVHNARAINRMLNKIWPSGGSKQAADEAPPDLILAAQEVRVAGTSAAPGT